MRMFQLYYYKVYYIICNECDWSKSVIIGSLLAYYQLLLALHMSSVDCGTSRRDCIIVLWAWNLFQWSFLGNNEYNVL